MPADSKARQRPRMREPFSGLSHLLGAGLAIAGLVLLVYFSAGKPWHITAFSIYGATLITLYLASAIYHLLPVGPRALYWLLALDQVAIYLLIAGTYTPICLVTIRGGWGWSLFGVVWGLAIVGSAIRLSWRSAPHWIPLVLYMLMGWLSIIAAGPLWRSLPDGGISWLVAGGILYSVGAVVFVTERPRLWPGVFGSHDLWHIFVLAGSGSHFVLMMRFVLPAP